MWPAGFVHNLNLTTLNEIMHELVRRGTTNSACVGGIQLLVQVGSYLNRGECVTSGLLKVASSCRFFFSLACGTTPRSQSGYLVGLCLFMVYPRDLYNAATSRTLVNPAVNSIFINNCKFVFLFIFVYTFNVEYFSYIIIYYLVKVYSYFNFIS